MKNIVIFSAVALLLLTVLSACGPQTGQDADGQRALDPNEQALRDAGYYDEPEVHESRPAAIAGSSPATPAFQRRVGETRRIPDSARLPTAVQRDVCALRRSGGEAELVRIFGAPDLRQGSQETGFFLLTWKRDGYSVSATLGENGTLDQVVAGSNMKSIKGDTRLPPVDLSRLSAGQSTLADVEALLGPGVLTKVAWEKGLDIPLHKALKRGLQEQDIRDHCELLHTWLVPGRAQPLTVAFDDNETVTQNFIAMF
jgi:hypothetical protein